jgi:hypothetical protein
MNKMVLTALLCITASFAAYGGEELKITFRTEVRHTAARTLEATVTCPSCGHSFAEVRHPIERTLEGSEVEYRSDRFTLVINEATRRDLLIDFRDSTLYSIDHKGKAIDKSTLDALLRTMDVTAEIDVIAEIDSDGPAKGGGFSVNGVGSEQVAGRDCEKWEIAAGQRSSHVSADPGLSPMPRDAHENARWLWISAMPYRWQIGGDYVGFFNEMSKIDGVHLKSEVVLPSGSSSTTFFREATEVVLGPVPASVFELPKGYRVRDAGKMVLAEMEKIKKRMQKRQKRRAAKQEKARNIAYGGKG